VSAEKRKLLAATAVVTALASAFFWGVAVYSLLFADRGALEAAAAAAALSAVSHGWFLELKLQRLIYALALLAERRQTL